MQRIYEDNSELELIEPSDVKTEFYIVLIEKEEEKLTKIKLYEKKHPIISKFIKIDDLI